MDVTPVDFDPFRGGEIARTAPSTEPQREIIASACMGEQANTAFNEGVSLRVAGRIDPDAIENALRTVIGRHEALRATFTAAGDEICIAGSTDFSLERMDFSGADGAAQEARIRDLWRDLAGAPMNLYDGPLFRAIWIRLGEDLGELILLAHHVICDGWSFHVVLEELSKLCSGATPDGLAAAPSFADFAERQRAYAAANADVDYWMKRFESRPPVLDLPTDRSRPAFRTFAATRVDHVFGANLTKSLAAAAGKLKASVVNVALAGTAALLHRLTGTTDMAIGLPVARQGMEDLPDLVGHGVQLLPIRLQVEPGDRFQDIVGRAKTAILDAREHFDFTFGTLIRDLGMSGDPSRVPLVPVIFNIDQPFGELRLGAATATLRTVPRTAENFEIFLNVLPAQDKLVVEATFNTDLFHADTIGNWLAALESLLADGAENPSKSIAALTLAKCCPDVYARLNDTSRRPVSGTWLDRFHAAADISPNAVAVTDGAGGLTYGELDRRSDALARALLRRGAKRGSLVGLYLTRSRELLVALMAVHKAGAAYLPLDPAFPESRLAFMLGDSGARLLLADIDPPAALAVDGLDVLKLPYAAADEPDAGPFPAIGPADLAYVIYTSGSTGKPKGVEVLHGGVANFLDSMAAQPGLGATDAVLAVTTLSFDISVLELLLPLTRGGRVVVATRDESMDARRLAEMLAGHDVTVMQATPATWRLLLGDGWPGRRSLMALCGGEALTPDLAGALLEKVGALWNLYGPTETTIWSSCARITSGAEPITIGRPIDNTTIYIMDEHGQALPAGVPGEICIGGAGLARGYHDRPELTAERFISHPELGRLYRTGDRGRVTTGATIEHLGRLDFQVKVRGYRIELGEIEAGLQSHPAVAQAVVVTREDQQGDVRLVAYLVAKAGAAPGEEALRAHLKSLLPEYMVPQHFVFLPAIPLLPNGKVDRRSLPAPDLLARPAAQHVAPRTALERAVAAEMEAVLHKAGVGIHDDFFALGGHSLLAAQLASRLNRNLKTTLSMRTVFEAPTVVRLAALISAGSAAGVAVDRPIRRLADQSRVPGSVLQERLWRLEQLYPGRVTYHAPSAHRLRGALDESAFERAFREIVRRQASLRTCFERDGDAIVQRVQGDATTALFPAEDLSALPPQEREPTLRRRLEELVAEPFDLTRAPLYRARLFRLDAREHVFFFMPHHIIWDGWSFDLLYEEMSALYGAFTEGRDSPLADLPVSYGDFAAWHREWMESPAFEEQLRAWRARLARTGRAQELPTDLPRRPGMSGTGDTEWIGIDKARTDAIHDLARRCDTTVSTVMLAAYAALLYGYGRQVHLAIGMPVRSRNAVELESIMGYFNTLMPLHFEIRPEEGFAELVARVKAVMVESLPFSDLPLERLLRELARSRGENHSVLYQALFSFQDARQRITRWGGLEHEMIPVFQRGATEDLGIWFLETAGGMQGGMTYNTDILGAATIRRLRERYDAILDAVVAAPSTTVAVLAGPPDREPTAAREAPGRAAGPRGYVAPRNDLEISLAAVWARVLGVPRVGIADDFFELGGNSLSVLNLSAEMKEATGIEINLGQVFQFPTIEGLVGSLGPQAEKQASVVVPLQHEGEGIPIFCLVGVNLYREFALSLGKDQPVYGVYAAEEQALADQAVKGVMPEVSIESLVEAYYRAITRLRPHGPYRLAGLSFGGVVAMEVASKMRKKGEAVDVVFLLDTLLPHGHRRNYAKWAAGKAAGVLRGEGPQMYQRMVKRLRNRLAGGVSGEGSKDRVDYVGDAADIRYEAFYQATQKWKAQDLVSDFRVVLFRASDHSGWGSHIDLDEDYGWRRYLGDRLIIIDVTGDHLGIVDVPNVADLAIKAREILASSAG